MATTTNFAKAIWVGEKKAIVTGMCVFVIWYVFIGKKKYGFKGRNRYV